MVFLRRDGEVPYFSGESDSSDSPEVTLGLAGRWRVERGKGKSSEEDSRSWRILLLVDLCMGPFLVNY